MHEARWLLMMSLRRPVCRGPSAHNHRLTLRDEFLRYQFRLGAFMSRTTGQDTLRTFKRSFDNITEDI